MSELSPESKELIRKHMLSLVVVPGIVLSLVSAAAGYIIHSVGQREAYVESFKVFSKPVMDAAQAVSGAKAIAESLSTRVTEDAKRIEEIRKRVEANEALADLDKTVDSIADRLASLPNFRDRVIGATTERLGLLEAEIQNLGSERKGQIIKINNPRMSGPDAANCPPGTFVSGISASGAVGGKYAVDGISEISVICTLLR